VPIRHWTRRSWDLPGSCGILVLMPRSSTPVRLHRLAIPAVPCCLPQCARRQLSQFPFFRGSFTQPVHSLCTLRSSGHPKTTQHSVRGRWLAFAGRGSHPLDPYARFQSLLHDIPLAQAFLAHAHYGSVTARHYARWTGGDYYIEPEPLQPGEVPADLLARFSVTSPKQACAETGAHPLKIADQGQVVAARPLRDERKLA
jgi:hypothetical protein